MAKHLLVYVVIFFVCETAHSQILVSRNFEANPLGEEIEKERRLFGSTLFGAEMGYGFFSAQQEQTWNIKMHGFFEFCRWGNRAVIGLSLSHELHVNPYNSIHFNPQGAIWNESLVYHRRLNNGTLQLGINHRCRHNIDNLNPPRQDPEFAFTPVSRVLVLTGISTGYVSDPFTINPDWNFSFFGRADAYVYREDSRIPRANQEGSWENIWGSAFGGFSLRHRLNDQWQLYTRNHLNYVFFEGDSNQINYRVETGVSLLGEKAGVSLFAAYERFFDDTSRPYPLTSTVLFVGIRGMGLDFF